MKFSTVAVTLGAASFAAAHVFDYNSAHLSKRLDRKPDSAWDFVTKGANLAKSVTERSSQVQPEAGKFNIANFNLRAKEVDPSSLGVDHVKQLSGYLDNDAEDKHLFYWFFESRNDPQNDPVVLWLNGGPGCSSLIGLFQELGPAQISSNGEIVPNSYSWNNNASVIFIDQPVNTGYSYTGSNSTDSSAAAADDLYALLKLFFNTFPDYSKQEFHIAGESYAGHYIPATAHRIVTADDNTINLKSILIGNGLTDPYTQYAYYQPMACGKGGWPAVLDDEICSTLNDGLKRCQSLIKGCYNGNLDSCQSAFSSCNSEFFDPYSATGADVYDVRQDHVPISSGSEAWLNKDETKKALGVEVSNDYEDCDSSVYSGFTKTGDWMRPIHRLIPDILEKIPVLVYAGDADYICNWLGNYAWTKALDWPGKDAFNAAEATSLEVGDKHYGNLTTAQQFAFAQIFGAGHMVPYDQPEGSLDLLNRWINGDLID